MGLEPTASRTLTECSATELHPEAACTGIEPVFVESHCIFVEIVGANGPNQSNLVLRGSTLLGNTGAGLRFQKGSVNSLDIGTANDAGYNVFGDSTAANRNGRAATAFTASLMRSMRSPESVIADATLSSGKSQTCRSRIFSK